MYVNDTCSLDTEAGRLSAGKRMKAAAAADPTVYHLKIVDTWHQDRIVGQGKWFITDHLDPLPKLAGSYWESEDVKVHLEELTQTYFRRRSTYVNDHPGTVFCESEL